MSLTHPFRTSRKSPHDDNGPNSDAMQTPLTNFYSVHRDNRNPPKSLKTKIGGES